ncbi:myomegalin isoform X14 [Tachysurus ichikawai]
MEWTDKTGLPSWPASERECIVDQQGNVCRNTGHMTDHLSDDAEKAPPLQAHTLREFEQVGGVKAPCVSRGFYLSLMCHAQGVSVYGADAVC